MSSAVSEPNLTENALAVLGKRYLIKDARGTPIETPLTLFWRVARTIAAVDRRYGSTSAECESRAAQFCELMTSRRFMPNSPTLMNAGRPLGQLSACFVLPISDCLSNGFDGIYDTLRAMALIHQSGGGTGFSFSQLRGNGSMVRSTTGVASGPVSFMKLYDASTDAVKQGGTRRGANMGILRVDHPDILEFVACKEDLTQVTNFNISVAVTAKFMEAVKYKTAYPLVDPSTGAPCGELDARTVWNKIIENAWRTGEPGVFFIDEANRYNPVPHLGAYEATNPCGEVPLLAYDVCNLGSLNVSQYVGATGFDFDAFRTDVRLAVRFLDNVIDANTYVLPEIEHLSKRIRRIGVGIMGFADLLLILGIPYDSESALGFGRALMECLDTTAKQESQQLAEERGAFPEWSRSIFGPDETCARDSAGQRIRPLQLLRNCNVTTIAPTGTISIFADCSSGIEPLFAVAFMRNQAGAHMPEVNKYFVEIARREGWYSEGLMRHVVATGRADHSAVPLRWRRVFVTANEIAPEWHIRMQAAFQQHTDSAISKTINFAHNATTTDVHIAYELAYALRCKGVTVYRDGSRNEQVLSVPSKIHTPSFECPACGSPLADEPGCVKCSVCGYEACELHVDVARVQ
jgi:ribonucleoside-diphosphate reductase alpha chain